MKSVEYLEAVKAKFGLKSDRQLALHLQMAPNTISQYLLGKRVMDDEACLAVALQLEIDPLKVLGAAFLDRAEKTGQKSLWEVFMNRAAATAGAVLVASSVNVFLTPTPANAASMRVSEGVVSTDYRLCEFMVVRLGMGLSTSSGPALHDLEAASRRRLTVLRP